MRLKADRALQRGGRHEQRRRSAASSSLRGARRSEIRRAQPLDASADVNPAGRHCALRRRVDGERQQRGRNENRRAAHLLTTANSIAPESPPCGTTTSRLYNRTRKFTSIVRDGSKKLSVSASSRGSTRMTLGPGDNPPIENSPLEVSVNPATILRVAGSKATTCAPKMPVPFFVTRPETLPSSLKSPSGYRSEIPAMSSAFSVRDAILPGVKAIGNMTASAEVTRRPPLACSSVSPSAECPSPLKWPIS